MGCRLQKGDNPELPYTKIVKKYQERLYWHIRRLVVEHENANDVLQNTFIKVWKNLSEFREDSKLYTWLYRIATNESLTFLTQQKKEASASFFIPFSGFRLLNYPALCFHLAGIGHFNHVNTRTQRIIERE